MTTTKRPDCSTLVLNADGSPLSIIPLSVIHWHEAIRLVLSNKVLPLDFYEDWIVRSPSQSIVVPSVVITKKYIKQSSSILFNKTNVFYRDEFVCQYCGKKFNNSDLTLDHVIPKCYGGKRTWDNIVTACGPCNWYRGKNTKIQPLTKPKKPSYFDLVSKRKKFPIFLSTMQWNQYLGWNESLIFTSSKNERSHFKIVDID